MKEIMVPNLNTKIFIHICAYLKNQNYQNVQSRYGLSLLCTSVGFAEFHHIFPGAHQPVHMLTWTPSPTSHCFTSCILGCPLQQPCPPASLLSGHSPGWHNRTPGSVSWLWLRVVKTKKGPFAEGRDCRHFPVDPSAVSKCWLLISLLVNSLKKD
jgi:hypothetical protein